MLEGGWHFVTPENAAKDPLPQSAHSFDSFPFSTQDKLYGSAYLSDIYRRAQPDYSARFTTPTLWDSKRETIVNNESSEVIRSFNSGFNSILPDGAAKKLDLYPKAHRKEIDELNEWVYHQVNNGVYKSGFATTQEAYESNVEPLFEALDRLEKILSDGREYLVGGQLTEADVRWVEPLFTGRVVIDLFRLYPTIVRFDPVYVGHFKCNLGTSMSVFPYVTPWKS